MKRIGSKLLLIIIGLLFGALLAEGMLRIAGYSYPEFYQPDQTRGYALRPNMAGRYRKEGDSFVRINSDGLRDREHSFAKPAGTVRIAVIGDSYPEAFPVSQTEAFWALMEKRLQECGAFGGHVRRRYAVPHGIRHGSPAQPGSSSTTGHSDRKQPTPRSGFQ